MSASWSEEARRPSGWDPSHPFSCGGTSRQRRESVGVSGTGSPDSPPRFCPAEIGPLHGDSARGHTAYTNSLLADVLRPPRHASISCGTITTLDPRCCRIPRAAASLNAARPLRVLRMAGAADKCQVEAGVWLSRGAR